MGDAAAYQDPAYAGYAQQAQYRSDDALGGLDADQIIAGITKLYDLYQAMNHS